MKEKLDYKNKKNSFTLIELLMVISIITLLSSILFSYVGSAKAKSRDAVRLSDMKQISTAANLYYEDTGMLPTQIGPGPGGLVPAYLPTEPKDPKTGQSYSFKQIPNKNAYVVSTPYETQFIEGSMTPQQVGVVIGDIDIITLCLIAKSSGINYPNCNDSNDSNDQIVGVASGHRGGGGGGNSDIISAVSLWVTQNNLMWQKSQSSAAMTWSAGNDYCNNLVLGQYSDWRLPSQSEIPSVCFSPDFSGCGTYYWTSNGQDIIYSPQYNLQSNYGGYWPGLARCVRSI